MIIIKIFFFFIEKILRKMNSVRLKFALAILVLLNILVLTVHPKDFELIKEASNYQIPSILYGMNEKGEFEPIAEFYQFSKLVLNIKDLKKSDNEIDDNNKLIQAFLASEDNDFYSHFGLDIRGIARAFVVNLIAGRIKEGASTISQQTARLKFLTNDRSFVRKAREAWLAILLESKFSKDQILEMYLNEIPLGHGTLGVGAAARFYFRKEVNSLNWGEACLLASLTTRPREFSPLVNPNISNNKVRVNFRKLVENGKMDIATAEKEYAKFSDYYLNLNRSPNDSAYSDRLNRFPYFTEHVRRTLIKKISPEKLYNGGLKVYSTLVIPHQIAAEKVLEKGLENQTKISNQRSFKNIDIFDDSYGASYEIINDLFSLNEFKHKISREERTFRTLYQEEIRDELSVLNFLSGTDEVGQVLDENYTKQITQDHLLPVEGSIISMRPETGYITAIVGGSEFKSDNQQIRTFQAYRQPGSSFKPLVYAVTLDHYGKNPKENQNITASTQFLDSPLNFILEDGDEWTPENYSEEYAGFVRLRAALESSKNSVAVRVVEEIGLANLLPPLTELLHPTGREIPKNFSVALGTFEVTPYEITRAYAGIASKGKEVHPISILQVKDKNDQIVLDYAKENLSKDRKQVLTPEASFIITSMMQDVIKHGTGKAVIAEGLTRPSAGKTGTTNNFRDAWFVGFTPELVSSVWLGYDVGTLTLGKGMAGGVVASPLWGRFMSQALKHEKSKNFDFGEINIQKARVCKISGKLPGSKCRDTYEEYFIPGTLDKTQCNEHGGGFSPFSIEPDPDSDFSEKKSKKKKSKKKQKNIFKDDEKVD
ncbi:MAG: PBP1A family penicillin-binding protein [Leptospiraceae bacterium]|nr:PBP1A family penicillin-binding protein [Leptospiraceae bacterium]